MSDNKKYYYLKLKENFYEDEKIIMLESLPDGMLYSNILMKLYLRSLKREGKLMISDRIPLNPVALSQITRHSVGDVEKAIKVLQELELIEILDNGAIYMLDIQNFIGKSSTEGDRKREYRKRIEEEKTLELSQSDNDVTNVHQVDGQMSGQMYTRDRDRDRDRDITRDRDRCDNSQSEINQSINQDCTLGKEMPTQLENSVKSEIKNNSEQAKIIEEWNSIDDNVPKVTLIRSGSTRQKLLQARINEYGFDNVLKAIDNVKNSQYLKGYVKPFRITFDWFIKPNNFPKVLDGNYNDFTTPKSNDEEFDYIKANQYTEEEIKNFKTAKDLYPDIDDYIVNIEDLELWW